MCRDGYHCTSCTQTTCGVNEGWMMWTHTYWMPLSRPSEHPEAVEMQISHYVDTIIIPCSSQWFCIEIPQSPTFWTDKVWWQMRKTPHLKNAPSLHNHFPKSHQPNRPTKYISTGAWAYVPSLLSLSSTAASPASSSWLIRERAVPQSTPLAVLHKRRLHSHNSPLYTDTDRYK